MDEPIVTIGGARFTALGGSFDEFQHRALKGAKWGRNLDGFNDVLRGGLRTPQGGFVLVWQHRALSRQRLGYAETARQLCRMLATGDPHNVEAVRHEVSLALSRRGSTVCDWPLDIVRRTARAARTPQTGSNSCCSSVLKHQHGYHTSCSTHRWQR